MIYSIVLLSQYLLLISCFKFKPSFINHKKHSLLYNQYYDDFLKSQEIIDEISNIIPLGEYYIIDNDTFNQYINNMTNNYNNEEKMIDEKTVRRNKKISKDVQRFREIQKRQNKEIQKILEEEFDDIEDLNEMTFEDEITKRNMQISNDIHRFKEIQRKQNQEMKQILLLQNDNIDDDIDMSKHDKSRNKQTMYNMLKKNKERESSQKNKKSENFQVIENYPLNFNNVGGYDNIKKELYQIIDILTNYTKYSKYNIRIPKGIILEGLPGNGKTLLAKAFAGECKIGFIPVSGSQFQEKYVGVGSTRIRELFELAKKNTPCIIYIDEIDSLGRTRSGDGESSSSERDSTLNELLVSLDGFNSNNGVFLIASTNRIDLLDPALIRPGRIDKKIYINNPDSETRKSIIDIHIKGKPYDNSISIDYLVELTQDFSGAQIENLLNEAMLYCLMNNREIMRNDDIEVVYNKVIAGFVSSNHQFSNETIKRIAIHEIGHSIIGLIVKNYKPMKKVVINLSSPNNPGYTIFGNSDNNNDDALVTKEYLFDKLCILLAGRISEELFYSSESTGAITDFKQALELSYKMITDFGMGEKTIYPVASNKYKELIDDQTIYLLDKAYNHTKNILSNFKPHITFYSTLLMENKYLTNDNFTNPIYSIKL
jgi:cell division protease FtsH